MQIWLPVLHEVDHTARRTTLREWASEAQPFEIRELDPEDAPVLFTIPTEHGEVPFRELPNGHLIRPVLDSESRPLSTVEQLATQAAPLIIEGDRSFKMWPDHPAAIDVRFDPAYYDELRFNISEGPIEDAGQIERNELETRTAEMTLRTDELRIIDGVPYRVAHEPLIAVSHDERKDEIQIHFEFPPGVSMPQHYATTVYFQMHELEVARSLVHLLGADPRAASLFGAEPTFKVVDYLPQSLDLNGYQPEADPRRWTIENMVAYWRTRLRGNNIMKTPSDILAAFALAQDCCVTGNFSSERLDLCFDLLRKVERHDAYQFHRFHDLGQLIEFADEARAAAEASPELSGLRL